MTVLYSNPDDHLISSLLRLLLIFNYAALHRWIYKKDSKSIHHRQRLQSQLRQTTIT